MSGRGLTCAISMPSARFHGGASGRTDRRSTTGLPHITSRGDHRNAPDPPRWAYFGLRETCTFDAGQTAAGVLSAPAVQAAPAVLSAPAVPVPPNTVRLTLMHNSVYEGDRGSATGPFGFDLAWVTINGEMVDDVGPTPGIGAWEARSVSTDLLAGQEAEIPWHFGGGNKSGHGTPEGSQRPLLIKHCLTAPLANTAISYGSRA